MKYCKLLLSYCTIVKNRQSDRKKINLRVLWKYQVLGSLTYKMVVCMNARGEQKRENYTQSISNKFGTYNISNSPNRWTRTILKINHFFNRKLLRNVFYCFNKNGSNDFYNVWARNRPQGYLQRTLH